MQIHIIAVGNKMPAWVQAGYNEYSRRMSAECRLNLIEIPLAKRTKTSDIQRLKEQEATRLLAAIPKNTAVWALEVQGKEWNTEQLAEQLQLWMQGGQDIALLIGGPDGLSSEILRVAQGKWSLSKLTLPHPVVRIVVAEQLYRALTIIKNHPYHK